MTRTKRPRNLDDLAGLISDVTDQIKVLVSAVDDLRCEVEWWARNTIDQRDSQHNIRTDLDDESAPPYRAAGQPQERAADAAAEQGAESSTFDSQERATEMRLALVERRLAAGRRGKWLDEWDAEDAPELPVGKVIPVEEVLWGAILDFRPAHVVGRGCCCEDGIGAPYLLAWQNEEGCFLRELSDEESYELQRACLDAQAEAEARQTALRIEETQLGLW